MSAETDIMSMSSVFSFFSLFFLSVHNGVDAAFLSEKPIIYINLFDEIVINDTSSKLNEVSTTPTPINTSSVKDLRKNLDLSADLLKVNDVNKTSASAPYDSIFEFEGETNFNVTSDNESDMDSGTAVRFMDPMDPEMLEPELSKIFFLKVITNLIEHIMETLFSIDETSKFNESPSFNYDSSLSHKLKKRDLQTETTIKANDLGSTSEKILSSEHFIGSKTDISSVDAIEGKDSSTRAGLMHENENIEGPASSPEIIKLNKGVSEHLTHPPQPLSTTLVSRQSSPHHNIHKANNIKSHASKEGGKSTKDGKNQHVNEEENVDHLKKHVSQIALTKIPELVSEDNKKTFHVGDERSPVLNDEVVNSKGNHFYEQAHPVDEHDGYKFDEESFVDEDISLNYGDVQQSSSLVTLLLISTTVMVLMLLVAFGLAAAYLFRKNQTLSGNQNASSVRTAVA